MWLIHVICRRLPHVSVEESPKEAKPTHSLDLSDTDTECDVIASVSMSVKTFLEALHIFP